MRKKLSSFVETCRLTKENCKIPDYKFISSKDDGNNGLFMFSLTDKKSGQKRYLRCLVCDEGDWDHVSISEETSMPTWEEILLVKRMFFDESEIVFQLYSSDFKYDNNVIHLWRSHKLDIPVPPKDYI